MKARLSEGINDTASHIICVENGSVKYVIDKICDHAGGRLIVKKDLAICPMHNWQLDLSTLSYANGLACKEKLPFDEDGEFLNVDEVAEHLKNPFLPGQNGEKVYFRWLNHATIWISYNGHSIVTDPWLLGPAFLTGWWLAHPSPADSITLLQEADAILISHNHPDHLHAETLSFIEKEKLIITANYASGSSEAYLRKLGFTNVAALDFLDIWEIFPGFQVSVLKSGDFRDDSGFYLCVNGNQWLLGVDANAMNHYSLPQHVDFLLTSFAMGATGFPICYKGFTAQQKESVQEKNLAAGRYCVALYIDAVQPKHFMPYAGMFTESAPRDAFIKRHNRKNSIAEIEKICDAKKVEFIQPDMQTMFELKNGDLSMSDVGVVFMEAEAPEIAISNNKRNFPLDLKRAGDYFLRSGFTEDLVLQIIPSNDDFSPAVDELLFVDFRDNSVEVRKLTAQVSEVPGSQLTTMWIRAEVLMMLTTLYLPWEDMAVGFQFRSERNPEKFEAGFWYHFTNVYIVKENFRYSRHCGSCELINQNPVWVASSG